MPMSTTQPRHAIVPETCAGRRLDAVLAELFPEYSRSRLSAWIKSGDVAVDGAAARGRDPVRGGESVTLNVVEDVQTHAVAEDIPLDILYEDEHVFVLDKPAGLVVHPGAGNPAGTLVNALLHRDPQLDKLPRAGIVHRLDKDTSGVLVVAKNEAAVAALVAQFSSHSLRKEYLALVWGALKKPSGTVELPVGRHPVHRQKMAVTEKGRAAVTHYETLAAGPLASLLRVRIETGRTHQIRVHLAHLGHPVVGDSTYGRARQGLPAELNVSRQMLHAHVLKIAHPRDGRPLAFTAPPPPDFLAAQRILVPQP